MCGAAQVSRASASCWADAGTNCFIQDQAVDQEYRY